MNKTLALILSLLLFSIVGCKATKNYPDPFPGWHNADYSTVFGRLQRVAGKNPEDPPVWIIRYGLGTERYGGELALTPPERLVGYVGGEQVEVKGSIRTDFTSPAYGGTWFEVQSIKMWSNYR